MADVQAQFAQFHDLIRLGPYDENQHLRDKRDLLVNELKERLPDDVPDFRTFNQGSYAYNTGTVPKDGNYDIDVGIVFDCEQDAYPNPLTLKQRVRDALGHPRRTVRIRRPCVTVEYIRGGEVEYHVDLAIYVRRAAGGLDLAVGREGADVAHREWQPNDPEGLVRAIKDRHSGEDAGQMRHCIRYLKRWRDHRFPNGDGPISCALTVAAFHWFQPQRDFFSRVAFDAEALRQLADAILGQFATVRNVDGEWVERLRIVTPVLPNDDLLRGMSDGQMGAFKTRLTQLRDALAAAIADPDLQQACTRLAGQFGDEFPVPTTPTAKKVEAPYVHTGQSA